MFFILQVKCPVLTYWHLTHTLYSASFARDMYFLENSSDGKWDITVVCSVRYKFSVKSLFKNRSTAEMLHCSWNNMALSITEKLKPFVASAHSTECKFSGKPHQWNVRSSRKTTLSALNYWPITTKIKSLPKTHISLKMPIIASVPCAHYLVVRIFLAGVRCVEGFSWKFTQGTLTTIPSTI